MIKQDYRKLLKPAILRQYMLCSKLRYGGITEIYMGINMKNNEKIIVKNIKTKIDSRLYIHRFRKLRHIKHPNIIKIYDYFEEYEGKNKKSYYLILEYIEGIDYRTYRKEYYPIGIEKLSYIFLQILYALDCLIYGNTTYHGDLTSVNIMIDKKDSVKLIDISPQLFPQFRSAQYNKHCIKDMHQFSLLMLGSMSNDIRQKNIHCREVYKKKTLYMKEAKRNGYGNDDILQMIEYTLSLDEFNRVLINKWKQALTIK